MSKAKLAIDEAIFHAKKIAEEKYLQGMLCHANPNDNELDKCIECAKEHEQLVKWLEELKQYRELEEQGLLIRLPCKPGSTIYSIRPLSLSKKFIISEDENVDMFYLLLAVAENRFGETVFLTKSEAEQKLRELEGK